MSVGTATASCPDPGRDLVRILTHVHVHDLPLIPQCVPELLHVPEHDVVLVRGAGHARDRAHDLVQGLDPVRVPEDVHVHVRLHVRVLVRALEGLVSGAVGGHDHGPHPVPGRAPAYVGGQNLEAGLVHHQRRLPAHAADHDQDVTPMYDPAHVHDLILHLVPIRGRVRDPLLDPVLALVVHLVLVCVPSRLLGPVRVHVFDHDRHPVRILCPLVYLSLSLYM
ncbi:hypothetical protein BJ546DRAFT_439819 [Cryomyces antarcticus]